MRQPILLLILLGLTAAAQAQVQVSEEPRHHKVLANEWVRVLDVHVPPHDTTLLHKHSTPSVFLVLSNTKTGSQVLVEPGKPSFADGNIWFESFKDTPRIHRVWNEDTVEFHVMDIELPHIPSSSHAPTTPPAPNQTQVTASVPMPDLPFARLLFDTRSVRVYRLTLPSGKHTILPHSKAPVLIIGLSGPTANGMVNNKPFTKKGDYLFIPGDGPLAIANNNTTADQQFAILYLK
jgi:hypothetical protein